MVEKDGFLLRPNQKKLGLDEGNTAFYRVIRSQIFRALVTIFGKITPLSYNKCGFRPFFCGTGLRSLLEGGCYVAEGGWCVAEGGWFVAEGDDMITYTRQVWGIYSL